MVDDLRSVQATYEFYSATKAWGQLQYFHRDNIMRNYLSLRNLLGSIFSVDVGLKESDALVVLDCVLSDEFQRKDIEYELCQIFKDRSVSWVELLDNESYVVYPADDEEDAKAYVVKILWDRVFPNTLAP
ncbi:hypothetical protein QNM99_12620 [Pseudomonas sp. PCH446]